MVIYNMDVVVNATCSDLPVKALTIPCEGYFYHHLFSSIHGETQQLPLADLLRKTHGLNEGQWLIVSPIHWQATHNDAMILAQGSELELTPLESYDWFDALRELISEYGMSLHYHDPYTWLLQGQDQPPITAKSVYKLHHQSLMPELLSLDRTLYWQRLITESQMFLNAHPLNKKREDRIKINGIWLWGQGRLNEPASKAVFTNSSEMLRLANLVSANVSQYSPNIKLPRNSTLLFEDLDKQTLCHLQQIAQKNTMRWYWNNTAYLTKPRSWISRFIKGRSS